MNYIDKVLEELINDFNSLIEEYAPNWYPHLIDDDENDGERFREKLKQSLLALADHIRKLKREHKKELIEEYRKGYNQCLKDQKLVGEKYQNLYL